MIWRNTVVIIMLCVWSNLNASCQRSVELVQMPRYVILCHILHEHLGYHDNSLGIKQFAAQHANHFIEYDELYALLSTITYDINKVYGARKLHEHEARQNVIDELTLLSSELSQSRATKN